MPRSALKTYLPQGLFLALLWLVFALKLAISLPVLLMLALGFYFLGVWLAHILAAMWQDSRRRAGALTSRRPSRRELVGIVLGIIAGLAVGAAVTVSRSPEMRAQLAIILPLSGAWLGRTLVRLPLPTWRGRRAQPRLSWRTLLPLRRLLLMTAGVLLACAILLTSSLFWAVDTAVRFSLVAFIAAAGAGLGLIVEWLLPGLRRLLLAMWFWTAGPRLVGALVGAVFGGLWEAGLLAPAPLAESAPNILLVALLAALMGWAAVMFINRLASSFWRRLALWSVVGTAVVSTLLAWLPPFTLTPGQVVFAGLGIGTVVSLFLIRPTPRVLVRSAIGGLLGVMLVSLNLETAVAPVSALAGIFFGLMATLIVLNWLQTQRA